MYKRFMYKQITVLLNYTKNNVLQRIINNKVLILLNLYIKFSKCINRILKNIF